MTTMRDLMMIVESDFPCLLLEGGRVELIKVGERFGHPRGHLTEVTVNPSIADLARLLAASVSRDWAQSLRVLATSEDVAAWDANDAPHTAIGRALPEFKGMRPSYYIISVTAPEKARYKIGRFPVRVVGRHTSPLGPRHQFEPGMAALLGPPVATNDLEQDEVD